MCTIGPIKTMVPRNRTAVKARVRVRVMVPGIGNVFKGVVGGKKTGTKKNRKKSGNEWIKKNRGTKKKNSTETKNQTR